MRKVIIVDHNKTNAELLILDLRKKDHPRQTQIIPSPGLHASADVGRSVGDDHDG